MTQSRTLKRRCPQCKHLRKFCEPPINSSGEDHPRRPDWWGKNASGLLVCGWCSMRARAEATFVASGGARLDLRVTIVRDVATGKILERTKTPGRHAALGQQLWEDGQRDQRRQVEMGRVAAPAPAGSRSARRRREIGRAAAALGATSRVVR